MGHFKTIIACDSDQTACDTYQLNFPKTTVICAPVEEIIDCLPPCEILMGGPPCQSFSLAGEGKGENDERNGIPHYLSAIKACNPRMFLMENVPGLIGSHEKYAAEVFKEMHALGYRVEIKTLDAVDFGVPQFRNRGFWWGIRNDLYAAGVRWKWPKPTHVDPKMRGGMFADELPAWITVGQALGITKPTIIQDCVFHDKRQGGKGEREDSPAFTLQTLATQGVKVYGGGYNPPAGQPERRTQRDLTEEPSTTIQTGCGNSLPEIEILLRPSPTLVGGSSKSHTNGASVVNDKKFREAFGELADDPKHPMNTLDAPAQTMRSGGSGHSPTGNSLKLVYDYGVAKSDSPSPTLKAGGNIDASGHQGGGCPPILSIDTKQNRTEQPIEQPSGSVASDDRRCLKADGKFVRRLLPAECQRIMSTSDDFKWPEKITKTAMYRIIGNGQASKLMSHLADAMHAVDPISKTVIDLFCGGGIGSTGFHGKYWEYKP